MLAVHPRVIAAVWAAVEPLLPRPVDDHPLGCHRPRIADRVCFQGLLCRLVTGCSWETAGRLVGVSETTLRRRRDEWVAAAVFTALCDEALAGYDRICDLDLSEVSIDGSLHKAPCGGQGTGHNPTDRAKLGWKWSIATDRDGVPLGWAVDGANRNDLILFQPTLDTVEARGLLTEVETLHLDRGYDAAAVREACAEHGITDTVIAARRKTRPAQDRRPTLARTRDALAGRAQQLVVVQLRAAAPQHRPVHRSPAGTDRLRRRAHPDRQTPQVGRPLEPPRTDLTPTATRENPRLARRTTTPTAASAVGDSLPTEAPHDPSRSP